jgi:hypothetical protein
MFGVVAGVWAFEMPCPEFGPGLSERSGGAAEATADPSANPQIIPMRIRLAFMLPPATCFD